MDVLRLTSIKQRGIWLYVTKADGGFSSCLDDLTREPEAQTLVEEIVRTKERNQILHLCMDELNPDYREALYLTYFEGMSYQQAAEVMGKSVKQITNMVYRGKRAFTWIIATGGYYRC